eukprot:gene4078-14173_t
MPTVLFKANAGQHERPIWPPPDDKDKEGQQPEASPAGMGRQGYKSGQQDDKDVSHETVMANPQLYKDTMTSSRKRVLTDQLVYIGYGTWHALVVYFVPIYTMHLNDRKALADNVMEVGTTIYFAIIITVNLKLAMRTRYWTWINHFMLWLAMSTLFFFVYLYGIIWPDHQISGTAQMNKSATRLFASPHFWLGGVLLPPILALLLDWTILAFQRTFYPTVSDLFQEWEKGRDVEARAVALMKLAPPATGRNQQQEEVVSSHAPAHEQADV